MPLPPRPGAAAARPARQSMPAPAPEPVSVPEPVVSEPLPLDFEEDDDLIEFEDAQQDVLEFENNSIEDHYEEDVEDDSDLAPMAPSSFSPFGSDDSYSTSITKEDEVSAFDEEIRSLSPEVLEAVGLLHDAIASDESTEILMNGPADIMMKKNGQRYSIPGLDFVDADTYHNVIDTFVLAYTDTNERIATTGFLIEGQMTFPSEDENEPPMLARVHVMAPPAVKVAKVTIAKKARYQYTIEDLVGRGSMTHNMGEFLKMASRGRLTTVLSGLSGAGKTTLLEAMSHHFDPDDRVIVVEDTPELRIPVADAVYMTAKSDKPGVKSEDLVTLEWLVKATNRMRPDRIIVGEVRGAEMSEFLIAANSGADGSMTTVHAANPRTTLSKMLGLSMKAAQNNNEMSVARDIASTVQLIVQATLIDGKHVISHIEEVSNTIRQETGVIATTTLFEYDRATGQHLIKSRPSEQLAAFLAQRGVRYDPAWFRGSVAS